MSLQRRINTPLFVTVLAACLGLSVAGVPASGAQAQRARVDVSVWNKAAEVQYLPDRKAFISPLLKLVTNLGKLISPEKRPQKLAAAYNPSFSLGDGDKRSEPVTSSYQNSLALGDNHLLLSVIHLARAALSDSLA